MENEQQTVATEPTVTAPQKPTGQVGPHISNPFTTTLNGIKKVFHYNTNSLIGAVLFNLVVGALMFITLLVILGALLAFVLKNASPTLPTTIPPQIADVANSLNEPGIYASWIIGLLLLVFFAALLQSVQIKLVTASSANQTISFGDLLKQGLRRVVPLLGLTGLVVLAFVAGAGLLALLTLLIGPIAFVLILAAIVAAIYYGIRISYAAFSVIGEGKGPIGALKRSYALTRGHFVEVVGVGAAVAVFVVIPTLILDLLALAVSGSTAAEAIVRLVSAVVGLIAGTLATAGFAERFTQLRNITDGLTTATKTHVSNYLAIAAFVILGAISNAVTPEDNQGTPYETLQIEQGLKQFENKNSDSPYDQSIPDESTEPSYNLN